MPRCRALSVAHYAQCIVPLVGEKLAAVACTQSRRLCKVVCLYREIEDCIRKDPKVARWMTMKRPATRSRPYLEGFGIREKLPLSLSLCSASLRFGKISTRESRACRFFRSSFRSSSARRRRLLFIGGEKTACTFYRRVSTVTVAVAVRAHRSACYSASTDVTTGEVQLSRFLVSREIGYLDIQTENCRQ